MFGDMIFSNIPFSEIDDTPVVDDKNYWHKLCPVASPWEKQDTDEKTIRECADAT